MNFTELFPNPTFHALIISKGRDFAPIKRLQVVWLSQNPKLCHSPEGATRLTATVYRWDPKNDLAAYVANWKTAWSSSGFTILEEEALVLEQGLSAVQFTVQTPDATAIFLVTTLGDQYLVLSGEGDLEQVKEIVQRVRPILQ